MAITNAIATVVGGVIQGSIQADINAENRIQQQMTNKNNLQIARENNQTSIDIAKGNNALAVELQRQQNVFNRQQWEDTNWWNSPENQMQLWKNAGLNPLSFNGGTPSSPVQQSSLPQLSMPNIQNPTMVAPQSQAPNIGDSIIAAIDAYNTSLKTASEVKKMDKETGWIDALNSGIVKMQNSEITYKGSLTDLSKEQVQEIKKRYEEIDQAIAESKQRIEESIRQVANLEKDGKIKDFQISKQEELYETQLKEIVANIAKLHSSAAADKSKVEVEKHLIKQIDATVDYIIAQEESEKWQGRLKRQEYVHKINLNEFELEIKSLDKDRLGLEIKTGNKQLTDKDLDRVLDIVKWIGGLAAAKAAITTAKSVSNARSSNSDITPSSIPNNM